MIIKTLFHIFIIFKDTPLSRDCMHKDSDLVPSITKYCHKHTESVLSPTTEKKDLRLNWVSVSLWQQSFCWRCTVHRKGTKRTTEKWHLVLLGHKLGRKSEWVAHLLPFALFVLFDASFQVLSVLSGGSGMEHIVTTSLRRLQASRCRVTIHPLIAFLLAPRFPNPLKLFYTSGPRCIRET